MTDPVFADIEIVDPNTTEREALESGVIPTRIGINGTFFHTAQGEPFTVSDLDGSSFVAVNVTLLARSLAIGPGR